MNDKYFGGCTCIIPFYNEGPRILNVLKVLTKVTNLTSIICIDDGSSDNTALLIKEHYKDIRVLKLKENLGKSGAVLEGIKQVSTEYIMLLDGDLYNLQKKEIEDAITIIMHDPKVDMLVLRRFNDPWFSKLVRGDTLVTGERILRKKDLLEAYKGQPHNYQLEMAINYYMMDHNKSVYWIPFSGKTEFKVKKVGIVSGLWHELKMYKDVFSYGGNQIKGAKSFFTFCKEKYPQHFNM